MRAIDNLLIRQAGKMQDDILEKEPNIGVYLPTYVGEKYRLETRTNQSNPLLNRCLIGLVRLK